MSATPGRLAADARLELSDVLQATGGELVRLGVRTTFAGVTKIFVIVNGKAEERAVRTGVAVGEGREISDGVKEGEQVVVSNLDKLEQGAPVTVAQ